MKNRPYKINLKSRHPVRIHHILSGIIVFLLVAQVVISNRLATSGIKINHTESEISRLSNENIMLSEKIASASAIFTIKQKALQLGFVKQIKPVYLSEDIPVALER